MTGRGAALRLVAVQLALAGMLLRGLLPTGWMPAQDFSSGSWLMVCDGIAGDPADTADQGAMPAMPGMNMAAMGHGQDPAHKMHDVCPFAAAAHLSASGNLQAVALPTALAFALLRPLRPLAPRAEARFSPGAPRGPPALA